MAVTPTKRARGANALLNCGFEAAYGSPPVAGYRALPFVSHQLGATSGWIESDLLGQGRSPFDPTKDVTVNDGNLVVPVDTRAIGVWLRLLLGAPDTSGPVNGLYTHVFRSGAATLPSLSAEVGLPTIPKYTTNYGLRANTLQISMQRTGLLNATLALIGKGETQPQAATTAGVPQAYPAIDRFAQASGSVSTVAGDRLSGVASAQFTYSNALDKVETIQPDGEIEDVDAGMPAFTGSLVLRGLDSPVEASGRNGTPRVLDFGWSRGDHSLKVNAPRAFFPRVKTPIEGPAGIQQSVDFLCSGQGVQLVTYTLVNDVASYAA